MFEWLSSFKSAYFLINRDLIDGSSESPATIKQYFQF